MALKVLNAAENEFSDEFLMLMAAVGYCVYGAELIMNKCARDCKLENLKECFFQEKKRYVNEAAKAFDRLAANLSAGFDGWFDKIQRGRADYLAYTHQYANDLVKLIILYMSRIENDPEVRYDIFKAIRQFPADDAADWEAVLEYFNKKF